ncbi:alpha/beta fold hydrolase [Kineococcus rubinsiae]|uniref:alpha/beta fold hydrolase n=1 Tax=Kineococcus rubinsiae TaxID=2609562 RepID=UPI001430E4FB|nr:alpha/beta hydrolase [Kineococcus rubinsiae]NIZ93002.1 alpha/beta fold hydrolase [Kineococcus rubinsiae]
MDVVLLPGLGCDTGQFRHQERALAAEHRVLALDLPGHGDAAPLPGTATLDAVVGEVAGRLDARGLRGAALVGHSTGGVVALLLAVARPDLVARLALLDANVPVTPQALAAKRSRVAAVDGPGWHGVLVEAMTSAWGPREPAQRDAVVAGIAATPEAAVRRLWRDVLALDPRPALEAVAVPALHVRSSRDVDAEALWRANPRFTSVDLRALRAGHWPHLVEPGAVTAVLRSFLAGPGD